MKMRIVRLFPLAVLLTVTLTAHAQKAPRLEIDLDAPASLADLQPLTVHITLRNAGDQTVTIPVPAYLRNVHVDVTAQQPAQSARCSAHMTYDGASTADLPMKTLTAGEVLSVNANLAAAYPLGLAPGGYRLVAVYTSHTEKGALRAESSPKELIIVEPTGSSTYDQMLDVCRAIQQRTAGAAERAIAFVTDHRDYPYGAAFLDYARQHSRGADRSRLGSVLVQRYPSTREAVVAQRDQLESERRSAAIAARRDYDARYAAEMARLPIQERTEVANALATIRDASDFQRVEQFLSRNQKTFFGGVALHAMIDAVHRGVLPPRVSASDREQFAADLTQRLARDYPDSYWAERPRKALVQ